MRSGSKHSEEAASRGVTLLELLVVAALASVVLALVFPSIHSGMNTMALRSSAQRLAAAAKFARDQAIFRQRPFELEIDGNTRMVSVFDSAGETRSFELPSSVQVAKILPEETDTASKARRFLFNPDGSSVRFQVILETSHRQFEIATDPLTGFPKISDVSKAAGL
jgi:general secretion pathway protein H